MKKKVLLLVFAFIVVNAFAQTEDDFEVGLTDDNNGVVIRKFNGIAPRIGSPWIVTIPTTIQGMPVREIGDRAFEGKSSKWTDRSNYDYPFPRQGAEQTAQGITSIVLPDGIIIIGELAFANCNQLTAITIPNTVREIKAGAFAGGIYGDSPKQYLSNLTTVVLPTGLEKSGYWLSGYDTYNYEQEAGIFENCKKLNTVTIPNGVKVIGEKMFAGCNSLTEITLPESLQKIGELAFFETGLTSVSWPVTLHTIPSGVFSRSNLQNIVIPEGVTTIDGGPGYDTITNIGAFEGCESLVTVTLPSTIKNVYTGAFMNCSALTSVSIHESVEKLVFRRYSNPPNRDNAFSGCLKMNLISQAALKRLGYTGSFGYSYDE